VIARVLQKSPLAINVQKLHMKGIMSQDREHPSLFYTPSPKTKLKLESDLALQLGKIYEPTHQHSIFVARDIWEKSENLIEKIN